MKADDAKQSAVQADTVRLDWFESKWLDGVHVECCAANSGLTHHGLHPVATVYSGALDGVEGPNIRAAIDAAMAGESRPFPQSEPLTDVTQQDVEAYVTSLNRQGTPWADGCAGLIAKLWIAQTATPQREPNIWEMAYCESQTLSLHPGVLYRFRVDPGCARCKKMAAEHLADLCPAECSSSDGRED